MFERFTYPARQVVVLAQEEADALKHRHVGSEHLLLGLLREDSSLAAAVLATFGVTLEEVRAQVARLVRATDGRRGGDMVPFTARAKKVLECGLSEALELGHEYIGPEHILLGLVRVTDGVAARVLRDFEVDASKVRYELVRTWTGPDRGPGTTTELVVTCPACATPLERITAQHPADRSEVSEDGTRSCAGCGREWTISYAVAWRPSVND